MIKVGSKTLNIAYEGQIKTCHKCGMEGHMGGSCETNEDERIHLINDTDYPVLAQQRGGEGTSTAVVTPTSTVLTDAAIPQPAAGENMLSDVAIPQPAKVEIMSSDVAIPQPAKVEIMSSEVAIPQPAAAQPVDTGTTIEASSEKNRVPETPMVTTVATASTSVVAAITAPIVSIEAAQTKNMGKNEDMFGLTQSQEEENLMQIEQVQKMRKKK